MTSMVVLALLVLALIGIVPATYGYTERCLIRAQALAAGQQYLDTIRQYIKTTGIDTGLPAAPVISIDPGNGFISHQAMAPRGNFTMAPSCSALSLFDFDCTVDVSWNESGLAQSVQVESYVASQAGF